MIRRNFQQKRLLQGFLPDRSVQGIVNSLVLMKLVRGERFGADPV